MLWVLTVVIVLIVVAAARRAGPHRPSAPSQRSSTGLAPDRPLSPPRVAVERIDPGGRPSPVKSPTREPNPDPRPAAASAQSVHFKMPDRGRIWREDYVPSEMEAKYVVRDPGGRPALRLVDAGDRLAIWSPADGGVLINPKGPGLRKLGLYSSYARGGQYASPSASRGAPRRPGIIVDLRRDPTNEHDPNAVGMIGRRGRFAWVQRGRAAAVARRVDAGEDLAAICLREGFFLIGTRTDLLHMLT